MKRLFFIWVSLHLSMIIYAGNEKFISNSDVKEVKVFLTGAEVTRKIKSTLEPGISKLVVENLSSKINPNTISVSGTGDITILSVQYEVNYLNTEKKTPEIIKLEDSLETLNNRLEQLVNTKSVYQEEQNMILSNKSVGGANVGVKTEDIIHLADFYRNRLAEIKSRLTELNQREKKLHEQTDKINKQLAVLNAKKNQPSGTIIISASAKENTTANLNLVYSVNDAGWVPFYDLRAQNTSSPVKIVYRANVFQATGEDWNDVKLALSSGNPNLSGVKPELNPWFLNYYVQNAFRMQKPRARIAEPVDGMTQPAADEKEKAVNAAVAVNAITLGDLTAVNNSGINAEFAISIPYTIPSDGKQYNVEIQTYTVNATFNYSSAPKLDKDVFLTSNLTGWENLSLMPGNANIYFEGTYVGETFIDASNTEDTLKVSMGREKKIIVKREKMKDSTASQFIGGNRIKTLTYEIIVKNTRNEKINLVLEDQLPVSQQKDIEVNPIDLAGAEVNGDSGKLTWKIALEPNATVKKKFSFTVKYPKDKVINGI